MSRVSTILREKRKRETLMGKGICVRCKIKPSQQNRVYCIFCMMKARERKHRKRVKLWKKVKVI